ncbi:uncharacterized protein B0H18DRAFT_890765 [Fomitopsis serialis]|uniref:uncharacterized protein n=1 Tax=Fomitopsis serialis TaxID=139415 RepID=UPI0020076B4B|nr:uncharacterized protein B0H18DRAFT_890765 [Neoantrodia serialis]KAH9912121.1 hypothetical protein B0H18DRAFT_890765 [Neoantrodia serialis]
MPLRYIRRKVTSDNAVTIAIATTAAATNLAGIAAFPPVAVPAAILLKIFQVIQDVKANQEQCYDLALRCLSFLDLIRDQVLDRNRDVPPSLVDALRDFAQALESIHSFLMSQAESNWRTRLVRKGSVEAVLAALNAELDDAFNAFQIATLINIHYAIGDRLVAGDSHQVSAGRQDSSFPSMGGEAQTISSVSDTGVICPSPALHASDESTLVYEPPVDTVSSCANGEFNHLEEGLRELEDHGFRRYDRFELTIKDSPRIKEGWWGGARHADVEGRTLLVKSYDEPRYAASKKWIRDVRILQNVFHPNLPQMVGFSGGECPTPFILLANVQTRLPQALVLDKLQHGTLADCVLLISRFVSTVSKDAALYLQQQLHLSDSKIQDYVENASYRIDGQQTLVMGLPPPEVDRWVSARNYDLSHSVRRVYLDLLPSRGMVPEKPYEMSEITTTNLSMQRKISHLTHALNVILPSSHSAPRISELQELLQADENNAESMAASLHLRKLKGVTGELRTNPPVWREKLVPAYTYSVGDLGYLERKGDFASFKLICNVIQEGHTSFSVVQSQYGTQLEWRRGPLVHVPLDAFPCPGNRQGWAVVVEPNADYTVTAVHEEQVNPIGPAGQYVLDYGQYFAKTHGVDPDDLMLITRVGVDLRFRLKGPFKPSMHNNSSSAFPQHGFGQHSHMSRGFGHAGGFARHPHVGHHFGQPPTPPTIVYISTSINKASPPTWSQSPVFDLQAEPSHNVAGCTIGAEA